MIRRIGLMLWLALFLVACASPDAGSDATSSATESEEAAVVEIEFYYPTAVGGPIADVFKRSRLKFKGRVLVQMWL